MSWFSRRRDEQNLQKELRFHLEQHTADLIARGIDPVEARRRARIELGGPEQVMELCREERPARWLDDVMQDCRYAIRAMRMRPGFTAVALLTLAFGIAAATLMFTLVNGVLLKPFAYGDPARLVKLSEQTDWSTPQGNVWGFSYPNYLDCKRESRTLDMFAFTVNRATLAEPGPPEHAVAVQASHELFPVLGVQPAIGRGFVPGDEDPSAAPVAILSYGLWQRKFGGSAAALGMRMIFDGRSYTIIGVAPAGFRLKDADFDLYTPLGQAAPRLLENRRAHAFGVWARSRPGASLAQTRSELAVAGSRLARQFPDSNRGRTFIAEPLRPEPGDSGSTLWILLGAVSLVLLLACANIASLLLARAVSREREWAMRIALGAGRGRLARQCLTESAVLALFGGAAGVLIAAAGARPFVAFWPGGLYRARDVELDWRVLLFALAASLFSGLWFGLAPALRAPVGELEQTLRAGARNLAGGSRRLHAVFVAAEIAIAMVLLISAGKLGRTLLSLSALDPGVDVRNVLTARTGLSPSTLADPGRTRAAWDDILSRGRHVPGVVAIAAVDTVPMRDGTNVINYSLSAAPLPEDKRPTILANCVTPDYLAVTGIRLRQGRFFTDRDRRGAQSVAVVDDVMAQQAFPAQDPVGKRVWIGMDGDPFTIVGVVAHVRQWGLAADDEAKVRAQLYYPFAQVPDPLVRRWSELMSVAVRTSFDPLTLVEPLRRELRGATGDQVLYEINTFEQLASASLSQQRLLVLLFGVFAGFSLLLACIGIYGVLAYLTGQRVPEIGVRMALGATAREVMWLVLRHSLEMVFAGIAIGLIGAVAAARLLERLVVGIQPAGAATFVIMIAALIGAALIASFLPAHRASRLDPVRALRQE